MDNFSFDAGREPLKVNQIACLEHQNNNLYGEVIQLVPSRQLCWFRPLCLVISSSAKASDSDGEKSGSESAIVTPLQETRQAFLTTSATKHYPKTRAADSVNDLSASPSCLPQETQLINLQSGSDLLWPATLFRPALDTEVIGFLAQLPETNQTSIDIALNKKYFNKFIHQVWQANQDKF